MKKGYKFSNNSGLEFEVIEVNGEDCTIKRMNDNHVFTFELKMLQFLANTKRITELEDVKHA
jgi:hypothetical protein